MGGAQDTIGQLCRGTGCAALVLSALLTACAPVPDPSAGLTPEESVALIDQVEPSDGDLETIAETFALRTRAAYSNRMITGIARWADPAEPLDSRFAQRILGDPA